VPFQDDELLYEWRRPLAFADDDEDDEDDIFTEDGLAEDEDLPADDGGGGSGGGGSDASGDMKRPLVATILFTLAGLLTPVLLILALGRLGPLTWPAMMMLVFSAMGAIAAIANLVYNLTKGKQYAVPFGLRTFFRWHELAAICVVLVPLAIANLAAIAEGTHFALHRSEAGFSLLALIKALPHALQGTLNRVAELGAAPEAATTGLFLGGALWGALGYAAALGLAGVIFAIFRTMNTPFGPKVEEMVNDDTGEVVQNVTEPTLLFKIIDYPYRMLLGYSAGATIGLLFGLLVIGLQYALFLRHDHLDPTLRTLLTAMGGSLHPDLAFAGGFSLAGMIVPLAFLTVGKFSPPGKSVSEAEVKARYVPAGGGRGGLPVELPAPAMISFGDIGPDPEEDLLADINLDASLTEELLTEFGDDLELVFGLDATNKSDAEIAAKKETMDRSQVAAIVEQSFGELGQIQVEVAAELGRASIALHEWLHLQVGTLVELNQPVGDNIDLYFNGVLKGRGRLSVVENHLGVQVSALNLHGETSSVAALIEQQEEAKVEGRT
jgi:flagellar motor switch/type III secretory pathway protein FliN